MELEGRSEEEEGVKEMQRLKQRFAFGWRIWNMDMPPQSSDAHRITWHNCINCQVLRVLPTPEGRATNRYKFTQKFKHSTEYVISYPIN